MSLSSTPRLSIFAAGLLFGALPFVFVTTWIPVLPECGSPKSTTLSAAAKTAKASYTLFLTPGETTCFAIPNSAIDSLYTTAGRYRIALQNSSVCLQNVEQFLYPPASAQGSTSLTTSAGTKSSERYRSQIVEVWCYKPDKSGIKIFLPMSRLKTLSKWLDEECGPAMTGVKQ